jgi:cyclophilin family peptidyl-prolyl cis-trans isomerase
MRDFTPLESTDPILRRQSFAGNPPSEYSPLQCAPSSPAFVGNRRSHLHHNARQIAVARNARRGNDTPQPETTRRRKAGAVSLASEASVMSTRIKSSLAAILLFAAVSAAGCGSHDTGALPAASIAGSAGSQDPSAAGKSAPNSPPDRLHPVVQLHTTLGDITIKLDPQNAPITVDNFLAYLDKGQYDNTLFHQVVPGAVILGGGYDTFGKEKPTGPPIRNEAHNGLKNQRGTVAMARRPDSVDSSTCQFFINLADNPKLDYRKPTVRVVDFRSVRGPRDFKEPDASEYGYCVFGEVVSGMDVADQIGKAALHDSEKFSSTPVEPVIIKWVHLAR